MTVKAETSLIEAVRMDTPNFGMLNAGRGNLDASKSTISVLLLNLLDYFTAEWNMTQLEDCSEIIATDFYWLSQAEFKIFTLRCKKGHFGTDYGKLSPQRLLLWLEDFSQECRFERAGIEHFFLSADDPKFDDIALKLFQIADVLPILNQLRSAEADIHANKNTVCDARMSETQQRILGWWRAKTDREQI